MPQNENTPAETPAMDRETASRVMAQRVTRRAALRKLGFGAGIAALALLSTDDLARMVGRRLEQVAGDNKIADTVAKELQGSGIASAAVATSGECEPHGIGTRCKATPAPAPTSEQCVSLACARCYPDPLVGFNQDQTKCYNMGMRIVNPVPPQ